MFVRLGGPEPLNQGRRVAKSVDVLRLSVECERNEPVSYPVAGQDAPDGAAVRVKVPFAGRIDFRPIDAHPATIIHIFFDNADRLDGNYRYGLPPIIEWQPVFSRISCFNCDAFARTHRANKVEVLVLVSVFPNLLGQEAGELIVAPP